MRPMTVLAYSKRQLRPGRVAGAKLQRSAEIPFPVCLVLVQRSSLTLLLLNLQSYFLIPFNILSMLSPSLSPAISAPMS
jgi:hypothetical protein